VDSDRKVHVMRVPLRSRRKLRGGLLALVVVGLLGAAAPARADEEFDEGGTLYAIQQRQHVLGHEFTLAIGTVPLDAFYKGLTGTFSYTYHFNDQWAWEIVGFTYSSNFWTGLKGELEQQWKVKPVNIPELNYMGDSNLVWKPLYGKLAYANRSLIYGEFFFTLGPAIAKYTTPGAYLGGNAGIGFRVHLSRFFSARLDVRYYRFQRLDKIGDNDDVLFITLGISLSIH
jgi:outer membrane beta-barrel protein